MIKPSVLTYHFDDGTTQTVDLTHALSGVLHCALFEHAPEAYKLAKAIAAQFPGIGKGMTLTVQDQIRTAKQSKLKEPAAKLLLDAYEAQKTGYRKRVAMALGVSIDSLDGTISALRACGLLGGQMRDDIHARLMAACEQVGIEPNEDIFFYAARTIGMYGADQAEQRYANELAAPIAIAAARKATGVIARLNLGDKIIGMHKDGMTYDQIAEELKYVSAKVIGTFMRNRDKGSDT